MSLGGSGGFWKLFLKGSAIYVPVGMIIGGGVAATGLPWWAAIPVLFIVVCALSLLNKLRHRNKGC